MENKFVQKLYDAPLDIIGDIHGEINALKDLINVLGYDENGNHASKRKLIFVGDLCDRGIDSVAVIKLVKHLVESRNAQCILGNHELNLLINSRREGNGWFFGSPHEDNEKAFNSNNASFKDRHIIVEFLNTLPLALVSKKLRIVHACWDKASIDALKKSQSKSVKEAYEIFTKQIEICMEETEIAQKAKLEELSYQAQLKDISTKVPLLKNLAHKNILEQMNNPIKVITSGTEKLVSEAFYAGGKWRMVERSAWWNSYQDDIPVVIGHYWRNFKREEEKSDFFKYIDPLQWFGLKKNVYCIDFSVGKRFQERHISSNFSNKLAALRFPENILILEDGEKFKIEEMSQ